MWRRRERRQRTGFIGFGLRWLRRIQRIAMLASIAAGVYRWWQSGPGRLGGGGRGGRQVPTGGPPSPSPLAAATTPAREPDQLNVLASSSARATPTAVGAPADRPWVEPLDDGSCPASHPVKVNETSGIYHVPGGRFYDRTVAGRWHSSAGDASADGYRPAKA